MWASVLVAAISAAAPAPDDACGVLDVQMISPLIDRVNASDAFHLHYRKTEPCVTPSSGTACPPTATEVHFQDVVMAGATATYSRNPVPFTSSGSSQVASTVLRLQPTHTARFPSHQEFVVRAQCGTDQVERKSTVYFGALWDVDARVIAGTSAGLGFSWDVRIVGNGSSPSFSTAELEGFPKSHAGRPLAWDVTSAVDVRNSGSEARLQRARVVKVTVSPHVPDTPYELEIRPSFNFDPLSYGPTFRIPLPVVEISGRATPGLGPAAALAAWTAALFVLSRRTGT